MCNKCSSSFVCTSRRTELESDEQIYFEIALDQDLLETIFTIYPEWFQDFIMADDSESQYSDSLASSPQAVVDDASLQHSMNRNKESLKVKLMLRRPINQLIDQGILPRKCYEMYNCANQERFAYFTHIFVYFSF